MYTLEAWSVAEEGRRQNRGTKAAPPRLEKKPRNDARDWRCWLVSNYVIWKKKKKNISTMCQKNISTKAAPPCHCWHKSSHHKKLEQDNVGMFNVNDSNVFKLILVLQSQQCIRNSTVRSMVKNPTLLAPNVYQTYQWNRCSPQYISQLQI